MEDVSRFADAHEEILRFQLENEERNDRSTDEEQKRVDGRHDGSVNNRVTTEYVKWLDR